MTVELIHAKAIEAVRNWAQSHAVFSTVPLQPWRPISPTKVETIDTGSPITVATSVATADLSNVKRQQVAADAVAVCVNRLTTNVMKHVLRVSYDDLVPGENEDIATRYLDACQIMVYIAAYNSETIISRHDNQEYTSLSWHVQIMVTQIKETA